MVAKNFDNEILLFRTSIDKTNFEKKIYYKTKNYLESADLGWDPF